MTWKRDFKNYRNGVHANVKVLVIPVSSGFKKRLRDRLMRGDLHASQWVDAVPRTVFSIMDSRCG